MVILLCAKPPTLILVTTVMAAHETIPTVLFVLCAARHIAL